MNELRILTHLTQHLPRIALAALISAAAELAGIALIATAAWLLASASFQPAITTLTVAIVAVRTFAISKAVLRYTDRLVGHDAVLRALTDLRTKLFTTLEPLTPHGHQYTSGDLLTRLISDIDAIQDLILRAITPIFTATIVSTTLVTFVAIHSPTAAAILLTGLLIVGIALPITAGHIKATNSQRTANHRAALASSTIDLVRGARDLAAYGATNTAAKKANTDATALAKAERATATAATATTALSTLVAGLTVIGVLLAAGDQSVMSAVLALTCLVGFTTLDPLPAAAAKTVATRASVTRVLNVLGTPPAIPDPTQPAELPDDHTLRLVNARPLISGRTNTGQGIDLELPVGKRVAIIGPSGAGKSMLIAMLTRFVPIGAGSVTLGGIPLQELRGDDIRRVIGGMTTDAHLFATTLRENLRIAKPDATDDELHAVLTAAGLAEWHQHLDLVPGENGNEISGGQRGRILLARALLANHAIMFLDEPTEHLDDEVADSINDDIIAATTNKSLILVTHRLTGLDRFDEIIVIDNGHVLQRGHHDTLLTCDGYYRDAWLMSGTNHRYETTTNI